MENLGGFIYLILGIIFLIANKSSSTQSAEPEHNQPLPDFAETYGEPGPNWDDAIDDYMATSPQLAENTFQTIAPQLSPLPPSDVRKTKIDQRLKRYTGWKKALVMSELLHPRYTHAETMLQTKF